ncbi:hypothetical protein [Anaerotruncus rubiinfantis]|uniref:hypothetical protein n=1 Tax=Anaerotruncus rubiinfantis TaxID=1720200 RepID=UPI0034A3D9DD
MKKVLALIMAVAMVMTMGVVAFAAGEVEIRLPSVSDAETAAAGDKYLKEIIANIEACSVSGKKINADLDKMQIMKDHPAGDGRYLPLLVKVGNIDANKLGVVSGYSIEWADRDNAATWGGESGEVLMWITIGDASTSFSYDFYESDVAANAGQNVTPYDELPEDADKTTYSLKATVAVSATSPDKDALTAALANGDIIDMRPLVKGADKLTNDSWGDSIKSGEKIYYLVQAPYNDDDLFTVEVKKGDGSKNVASAKVIEDKLTLFDMETGAKVTDSANRNMFIEVAMKENYTDDETKITFDVSVKAEETSNGFTKGTKIRVEDFGEFWMKNSKDESDDVDHVAGTGGIVIKPVKNEENTILWEDENDELAKLTFTADSDTKVYYPKLSTKWDNILYAELFADQDAFVREFVSNPQISSTSRAKLELYVPYIDEDDELTVDEDSIIVYEQDADGNLIDITDKGTFEWNDDDNFVFTMKTRQLGTYIFAEAPVTEAADDEAPADEVPVDTDKVNPGTGF